MRKLTIGLMAAAGIALAAPAYAESGVYIGAGPVGVGVGVDVDHDHDRNWRHHYARDRDEVVIKKHHHRDCRTTIIHDGNVTKKIRRCD